MSEATHKLDTFVFPETIKRVAFFAPRYPTLGGGSTYIDNMRLGLISHGITVEAISLLPGDRVGSSIRTTIINTREPLHKGPSFRGQEGVFNRIKALPLPVLKSIDRLLQKARLRRILNKLGPDTVLVFTHVKCAVEAHAAGWSSRKARCFLVGQHHSQFESIDLYTEKWLREAIRTHFQFLDGFTALTGDDAEKFSHVLDAPCFPIPNPVLTPTLFHTPKERLAVALARYSGEKELDIMARCFAAATELGELNDWKLQIFGEGPLESWLREYVAGLNCGERVQVMGPTQRVHEVLTRASLHLITSSTEGFPMSILEAASHAVPTIAFDVSPGIRELVRDQGYLVSFPDEETYIATLAQAMLDDEGRRLKGVAARRGVERYSVDHIMSKWAAMLTQLKLARDRGATVHSNP